MGPRVLINGIWYKMVRSIDFAVLRSMTNSNLVACFPDSSRFLAEKKKEYQSQQKRND